MKRLYFCTLFLLLLASIVVAQSRRTIRVAAGEDIAHAYSANGFYRFPEFSKATIFYRTGGGNDKHLFNYNVLSGTMQYIDRENGDTLDLMRTHIVDSVVFSNATFYLPDGYMEVLAVSDSIRLLKKTVIKFHREKVAGYGIANPVTSAMTIQNYSTKISMFNFRLNEDVVMEETIELYWMDKKKTLLKATKANLFSLLSPARKSAAEAYLKKNKTNFEKADQLIALVSAL